MTEPEGLTATERALLEHAASVTSCRIDGRVVARWMHCYDAALAQSKADREWCGEMTRLNDLRGQERDAALARAEAAERVSAQAAEHLERHRQEDPHELQRLQHELWDRNSECKALSCDKVLAESALTEATALLRMWHANVVVPGTLARLEAFLSAAPAPAAESGPDRALDACDEAERHCAAADQADDDRIATLVERIDDELRCFLEFGNRQYVERARALIRAAKEGA